MGNCISSPKNNIIDYIGLDVLYDVLAFLGRKELAFGVEIASKLFKSIIDRTRLSQFPSLKIQTLYDFNHFYKLQFFRPKYGGLLKRHCMRIKMGENWHNIPWNLLDKPPPYLSVDNIYIKHSDFLKKPSPLARKLNPNAPARLSAKKIGALKRMGHCFEQSKVHFEIPLEFFIQQELLCTSSSSLMDINNLDFLLEFFLQIFTNCNEIHIWIIPSRFFQQFIPIRDYSLLFKNASILNCSNLCIVPKSEHYSWIGGYPQTSHPYSWFHEYYPQIPLFDIVHLIDWLHSDSRKFRSLTISFNLLNESAQRTDFLERLLAILSKEISSGTMSFSYNLLIYGLPEKIQFTKREFVHQENSLTGEKLTVILGRREYFGCRIKNFVRIERF